MHLVFIEKQGCNNNISNVYIYIYIYMEIVSFLLYLRDRQMRHLASTVFLYYSLFRRVRLLLENSFLILLSSVWISDNFSHLNLRIPIFIENSPWNKHFWLINQSRDHFVFFCNFLTGQPIKCVDLRLWEEDPSTYQILNGHPIKPYNRGLVN